VAYFSNDLTATRAIGSLGFLHGAQTGIDMTGQLPAWGKTDDEGRPAHHLVHHSMDVAAVFERLVEHPIIGARLATAAGRPLAPAERAWLAALAFLHDVGKLSPDFQTKAWPEKLCRPARGHLQEGCRWVAMTVTRPGAMSGHAHELFAPFLGAASGSDEQWLIALFAHHGRPIVPRVSGRFAVLPHYDWRIAENEMGAALGSWFAQPVIAPDVLERASLVHLYAGLLALADWIGSDLRSFPHELTLDLDGYAVRARQRAGNALRRIGLSETAWPSRMPSFGAVTGHDMPRGTQAVVGALPVDVPLAIIEAETGSGKTEAALWHFARLRSAKLVDALYFAVPTRAAASQLHRRVHEAMVRLGGPEAILAVPGQLRAGESDGVRLPGFEVRWDDGGSHWAAEHATRFLAAPVAVGTVDQALMAGLLVKHAHLRGAALSRSLLVIDEVHASDAYMNRVARGLVRDHLALGGKALLMSATLGSGERAAWLGRPPPTLGAAVATPYPAVWRSDDPSPLSPPDTDDPSEDTGKPVVPILVPTMSTWNAARIALDAARAGARVLVVRNTVKAAIDTWEAVVAEAPSLCFSVAGKPALHHSRFAAEDRRRLDEEIEKGFGVDSPSRGLIAVGTQTLEQSLDIDADLLITDLCPMDVLLQRIGRLHRHRRARPDGFGEATVHVLCPEDGLDRLAREGAFENGLGAWQARGVLNGIYTDLRSVEATRKLVEVETRWSIPADNRRLVEAATHSDELDRIEREKDWHDYSIKVDAKAIADTQHGASLSLDRSAPFPDAFPDVDEAVQTRLGARGPVIELPDGTVGPFGLPITRIAPPARWCLGLSGEEVPEVERHEDGLHIAIGDKRFVYDFSGVSPQREASSNSGAPANRNL